MRILHITDLHYGEKYKNNIDRMLPSMFTALEIINSEKKIDIIVFSGDIVYSGDKFSKFEEANSNFIEPLYNHLKVSKENLLMCGGNHDLDFSKKEMEAITSHISKISNNDDLDKFIKDKAQLNHSYIYSDNYFKFVKKYYPNDPIEKLSHTFIREIDGQKIGFVSLHTTWRALKGNHSGQLLLPKLTIYKAYEKVKECELKIAIMHQPLEDLKGFNQYEIEDIIYEKFHLSFSGHYHKKKQLLHLNSDVGMISLSSSSSMSGEDGSSIGFTIVDIDILTYEIELYNYSYDRGENVFSKTSNHELAIPINGNKNDQLKVLKAVKNNYSKVLSNANKLLIYEKTELLESDFSDLFTNPILKNKSYYEFNGTNKSLKEFTLKDIESNNFIIYGKDKSGKSSLLYKICLDLLENYKNKKTIPIYIDFNDKRTLTHFDLTETIKEDYNVNKQVANNLISKTLITYLIDNFDTTNENHTKLVSKLKKSNLQNNFVITSVEAQSSNLNIFTVDNLTFNKAFLYPINRTNIRSQTRKVLRECSAEECQSVIERISIIFTQLNIPFNYWSLSLFLYLYKKDKKININDNIELIELYIDKLLSREHIALMSSNNIDYALFKKFLGELSHELIANHKKDNYSLTFDELVAFVTKYKNKNLRFVTNTKELIDYLLNKSILTPYNSSERYTFRLNGVMEYFTAVFMDSNKEFTDDIINNDSTFIRFANEFEILAGFKRSDLALLQQIRNKVEPVIKPINDKYKENPDSTLLTNVKDSKKLAKLISTQNIHQNTPMTFEEQDVFFDEFEPIQDFNEDVKVKEPVIINQEHGFTHSQIERHLFILSRVFRSQSLINDENVINETFDFIIDSSINLGFELLHELNNIGTKTDKEIEKFLINLFSNLIPIGVQMGLSEGLLHNNFKVVIENKIEILEKDRNNNQYKLMLLYFLLLDIDIKGNKSIIDKIAKISLIPLVNASVIKMFFYLLFKGKNNESLLNQLKDSILALQVKQNPKLDKNIIKQNIDKILLNNKSGKI